MSQAPTVERALALTIRDHDHILYAHCQGCGWSTEMPFKLLGRKVGNLTVASVIQRLKCKRCGIPPSGVEVHEHNGKGSLGQCYGWTLQLVPALDQ